MNAEPINANTMDVAVSIEKDIPSRITGENRVFIRAVIARAITAAVAAEREACAQYMNSRAEQWRAIGSVTGNTFGNIYDEEASAIRARSTP